MQGRRPLPDVAGRYPHDAETCCGPTIPTIYGLSSQSCFLLRIRRPQKSKEFVYNSTIIPTKRGRYKGIFSPCLLVNFVGLYGTSMDSAKAFMRSSRTHGSDARSTQALSYPGSLIGGDLYGYCSGAGIERTSFVCCEDQTSECFVLRNS